MVGSRWKINFSPNSNILNLILSSELGWKGPMLKGEES